MVFASVRLSLVHRTAGIMNPLVSDYIFEMVPEVICSVFFFSFLVHAKRFPLFLRIMCVCVPMMLFCIGILPLSTGWCSSLPVEWFSFSCLFSLTFAVFFFRRERKKKKTSLDSCVPSVGVSGVTLREMKDGSF